MREPMHIEEAKLRALARARRRTAVVRRAGRLDQSESHEARDEHGGRRIGHRARRRADADLSLGGLLRIEHDLIDLALRG